MQTLKLQMVEGNPIEGVLYSCFGIAEITMIGIGALAGGALGAAVGAIILPAIAYGIRRFGGGKNG